MKTKLCNICKKIKDITKFYKYSKMKDELRPICKSCKDDQRDILTDMYRSAKKRAKRKELKFDITHNDIRETNKKQNGICAYSGISLNWDSRSKSSVKWVPPYNRASLDRIDSKKGYTKDNIQVLADIVNRMKNALSYKELIKFCQLIVDNSKIA